MNKSDSIAKISVALLKAQKNMGSALKDAKNPFFKSKYADLNAIREAAHPALNAEGITVMQPMVHLDGRNFVETLLLHESGEFISGLTEVVTAKQNDPQALGSAISYARRYGLQSFMSIGAEDDDGEKGMGRTANKTEVVVTNAVVDAKSTPVKSNGSFKKPQVTTPTAKLDDGDGW